MLFIVVLQLAVCAGWAHTGGAGIGVAALERDERALGRDERWRPTPSPRLGSHLVVGADRDLEGWPQPPGDDREGPSDKELDGDDDDDDDDDDDEGEAFQATDGSASAESAASRCAIQPDAGYRRRLAVDMWLCSYL